jgi:4'-phosphopantetheinyl transferase
LRRRDRFRTEDLKRRFVAGRGGLRAVLAMYLGCDPSAIVFDYGPHGKPALAPPFQPAPFAFNLTHSGELALCALSVLGAVGVDLEKVRPMEADGRGLIGRFFSEVEQAEYLSLAEHDRLAAFFRGWTRKEAFLKATGTGLATVLDSFDVTLGSNVSAAVLRVGDDPTAAARWSLFDLDPGPGYAAALAVESCGRPVRVVVSDLISANDNARASLFTMM